MRSPAHSLRLVLVAIACTCFFGAGSASTAIASSPRTAVANSVSVIGPGDGTTACSKRAARIASVKSRAAQSASAARKARRAGNKQRRRCLTKLRQAAKRKRATASALITQAPGNLLVGIDGGHGGWSDSEIAQRAELGAAVTRHEWDPSEPIDEQEDVVETAAGEIHTRIHPLLGGNDLGEPNHYREFVIAFIRRYGVGGSFWAAHPELDARLAMTTVELGNEPYFGEMSPEEYAATVGPVLEEIQRLQLPVQVVLPSRVYGKDTSWIDTLYARIPNLNSLFYAFADHPYWYGHDPAEVSAAGPFGRIETLRRRMNEKGANTKPIFITEYGESTASCGEECIPEEVQAQHLQQMIDAIVSRPDWGVKMLSVFQLVDRGTNSSDRELQFGLLREDGSAKPSYSIVRGAVQQYRG
ncbi:MAG TPA: hypothetical protein VFI03_07465 [Solirubrobacterales bacterium]|nr:hypothetical protein [Solirubrobacterales bacterium]